MDSAGKLHVRLLGELALLDGADALPLPASRKTRALFVYLLLNGRPARRERLCELFFPIPDDPRGALRWSLSKIRAMLGPWGMRSSRRGIGSSSTGTASFSISTG